MYQHFPYACREISWCLVVNTGERGPFPQTDFRKRLSGMTKAGQLPRVPTCDRRKVKKAAVTGSHISAPMVMSVTTRSCCSPSVLEIQLCHYAIEKVIMEGKSKGSSLSLSFLKMARVTGNQIRWHIVFRALTIRHFIYVGSTDYSCVALIYTSQEPVPL